MKRILIGALAGVLLISSAVPALAQGGFGRGRGPRWSQGGASWGGPMGMRNGMGPGAFRGNCPRFAFNSQAAASNALPVAPGTQAANPNMAPFGRGLMNGTGPRALNGTCPRLALNPPPANAPAATTPPATAPPAGTSFAAPSKSVTK